MKRITRLANKNDVDGIYEIEAANFDFPWSKNAIENSIINDDLQDIVITEVDGILVGYISYMIVFDEIHIANVAVRSEYRGQKISLDLFDFLTKKADEEKLKITLEVAEKNKIAINLYRKYNFKISGMRKNYYGIDRDAYIMWREWWDESFGSGIIMRWNFSCRRERWSRSLFKCNCIPNWHSQKIWRSCAWNCIKTTCWGYKYSLKGRTWPGGRKIRWHRYYCSYKGTRAYWCTFSWT